MQASIIFCARKMVDINRPTIAPRYTLTRNPRPYHKPVQYILRKDNILGPGLQDDHSQDTLDLIFCEDRSFFDRHGRAFRPCLTYIVKFSYCSQSSWVEAVGVK